MALLIDTNVVSYLMRGSSLGIEYGQLVAGHMTAVSVMTVAELYYGAAKAKWGAKRMRQLEQALRCFVLLPDDRETAQAYAAVAVERESAGRPITCADALVAACAVRYGIPLVTHNARDFAGISGLKVITANAAAEPT